MSLAELPIMVPSLVPLSGPVEKGTRLKNGQIQERHHECAFVESVISTNMLMKNDESEATL